MQEDMAATIDREFAALQESLAEGSLVRGIVTLVFLLFFGALTLKHLFEYLLHYIDIMARDPDRAPAFASYAKSFFREWYYAAALTVIYPFGLLPLLTARGGERGGPPVLLVHGYLMNRLSMAGLYFRMKRLGYANVEAVNLSPAMGDVEDIAARLSVDIRSLSQRCGGRPVVIVAHSMGGIVARFCAAGDQALPIAKIVTLGSPHHGTRLAVLGIGANALAMRPGSQFLRDLEAPPRVPLVSLYSRLDNMVIPDDSAVYGERSVPFTDPGHLTLLFDKQVFRAVARELSLVG